MISRTGSRSEDKRTDGPALSAERIKEARRRIIGNVTSLDSKVRSRVGSGSSGGDGGFAAAVTWVSANLLREIGSIRPDEVPSSEALGLLVWAKGNETQYRVSYDCKRIPAKGFAGASERGFVDDGSPVGDVLAALREGLSNVQVRVMPKEIEVGAIGTEVIGSGVGSGVRGVL